MLLGVTYAGLPLAKAKQAATASTLLNEQVVRVTLPKDVVDRLAIEADRVGLNQDTLAELFITRGLENRPALITIKDAVDSINKARIAQAMREAPELKDILMADLGIAVKAGENMTRAKRMKVPPAEKLTLDADLSDIEEVEE
jgi:ABC-type transport system involved in Fe-S cluster assembly fused permease/ATPase subunit